MLPKNRRKLPEDYRLLASEHGLTWIGPEVPNTNTKTTWQCEEGHQWESTYGNVYMGHGCPYCAGKAPKTPEDYHALAKEKGFEWVGPPVRKTSIKTTWRCSEGHEWETSYGNIYMGHGCPYCSGSRRLTEEHYHELADSRGFRWLGPCVRNNRTKTTWECSSGHQWQAPYNSIRRGLGCPHCAQRAKKTDDDYSALAKQRGFKWIGGNPGSVLEKTLWECSEGHQWEARYSDIDTGYGCPFCAGTIPKTPADYHELAAERGFRWLGPEVPTTHDKTTWECGEGHLWEARYNDIQSGRGCPTCVDMCNGALVSKLQRELCQLVDGELNVPCGPYRIDVGKHLEGVKIAIEYDSWYWHGGREEEDTKRDEYLKTHGWRLIHVRSNACLPSRKHLDETIKRIAAGATEAEIVLHDWGVGPTRLDTGSERASTTGQLQLLESSEGASE